MCRKINADKYISFLKKLNKRHRKLCIIGDNAPWHGPKDSQRASTKVKKYLKDNSIEFIQIPPYSPELNPIEIYWRNIKRWIGTKPYSSLPELKTLLRQSFRKDFLIVNISDY